MVFLYAFLSVLVVSLISLIGLFTLSIKVEKLKIFLIYLIAFSAGALFGDAFIHLLPELINVNGFEIKISFFILLGISSFFVLEKIVYWKHCHMPISKDHVHSFAIMNLIGDGLHNFIDGLVIGVSYIVSVPIGITTTVAVLIHEIPQEIGDFGVLIHGGFSKKKALLLNFASALLAVLGVIVAFIASSFFDKFEVFLISLTIGGFIYIAGSDLIPELHKEFTIKKAFLQFLAFALGIALMVGLLFLE